MGAAVQAELLPKASSPAPAVTADEVQRLVEILRSTGAWMTRRELASVFGGEEIADRKIRAIAEVAAPVVVSWPGSPGYRHWDACTVAEISHCIDAFESSGKKQFQRAHVYRRAYHQRFRAAVEGRAQDLLNLAVGPA